MKVYLVYGPELTDHNVEVVAGVYSTKQKAQKYIDFLKDFHEAPELLRIEEREMDLSC